MAGPGDNTRNRPKNGSDTDAFKRAVTVCMRAISGDNELEVGFAKDKPALAGNRAGAVGTIDQFAANFARSAELLNSANNFIPNRLANLDRVIDYIDANKPSLQREFGSGEAAKASGEFARALEAYQRMAKA